MSFTDADLIARVLAHEDQHAFGELVRRNQSPVRAFLARMTRGDSHLADDLAQETFLKAWRKLETYRGTANSRRGCSGSRYNEFRDGGAANEKSCSGGNGNRIGGTGVIRSGFPQRFAARFDGGAEAVKFSERAAIVLCCQNGLSHEEAAQVLECPLGTVKTNVLRGKEKLRRRLPDYQHYESA